ncbi:TetR family transcriptional regulator [Mycolicibacterium conceptionense]|uniref:TetR family transcriptional regulator n=2 Tax=Mycolicibacterium TaxID=1866885 RepID=A0A1A0PK58_9MYCO|nr:MULTISPECIES: TetR/AcrR family transcriptional regulator [Mycolicibacterium]MCW1823566.1 TetR/AcrR family transcriptional regulator [Mycolicibacterium senegalense]OBB10113.1 TetR family transcriptional regulator [Mycolicibacterium conceptionense]OBF08936.1 TetR family transcriptional regulator [Mycolicibacterium conceptionense]OBF28861.1 TetR family transcriptional regulator [Mycolicibacterium conceptionense]OBF39783.1 TetR family transcriptional regulator [Mycolicibacterium conceptionense]
MSAGSTRERLVTEAMKLFSDKGFEATSVSQIEAAAGLSAGSGALYRHFKSKDALLSAGIDRQLDRRSAMQDIRALFAGLGDLHSELTVLGRYLLTVIDQETELLQVAARTPAGMSDRLDTAYAALVDGLCDELHGWINVWAPNRSSEETRVLASLGINSLLGERFAANLFRRPTAAASDDEYLKEWTATLAARVEALG